MTGGRRAGAMNSPAIVRISRDDAIALTTAKLDLRLDEIARLEKFEPLLAGAGGRPG